MFFCKKRSGTETTKRDISPGTSLGNKKMGFCWVLRRTRYFFLFLRLSMCVCAVVCAYLRNYDQLCYALLLCSPRRKKRKAFKLLLISSFLFVSLFTIIPLYSAPVWLGVLVSGVFSLYTCLPLMYANNMPAWFGCVVETSSCAKKVQKYIAPAS